MHKEILPVGMFDLLADLMKYLLDPDKEFRLLGDTALALQLGHRLSVDIDLFTHRSFGTAALLMRLREDFSGVEEAYESANGLNLFYMA